MVQKYEAGKEFSELLIANYDMFERQKAKPSQLTLFEIYGDIFGETNMNYETMKECILQCKKDQ